MRIKKNKKLLKIKFKMKKISLKTDDGNISILNIPGPNFDSPVLHWAHANGFNALTYLKLLKNLSNQFNVYAWDARGHGRTNLSSDFKGELYKTFVKDFKKLLDFLFYKHGKKIICAGHSFGATLTLMSCYDNSEFISKIILADPVIFTNKVKYMSKIARFMNFKRPKNLYLSQNALNRRNRWKNLDEAYAFYKEKKFFLNWEKSCIKNYLKDGTKLTKNGIKLSCDPALESMIFKESENLNLLKEIKNFPKPIYLYIAERNSPAFGKNYFKKNKNLKQMKLIKNSDHFFPLNKNKYFCDIIKKDLKT